MKWRDPNAADTASSDSPSNQDGENSTIVIWNCWKYTGRQCEAEGSAHQSADAPAPTWRLEDALDQRAKFISDDLPLRMRGGMGEGTTTGSAHGWGRLLAFPSRDELLFVITSQPEAADDEFCCLSRPCWIEYVSTVGMTLRGWMP